MKKLLLIEDDKSLGTTLFERLTKEGYKVDLVSTAKNALDNVARDTYDLFILDVGLPDLNGFELAKEIKKKSVSPFIFVTAQNAAEDRLLGYELGADEYIPKPFHLKELLLRVAHVIENHVKSRLVEVNGVRIDLSAQVIIHENEQEVLNYKEAQVLRLLIERSPQVLSRDEILNSVWGENEFPTNRTIDNVIVRLRQLLREPVSQYIRSVRGVGYQWLKPKQ